MRNLFLSNHREYSIPGLQTTPGDDSSHLLVVDHLREAVFVHSDGNVYRFSVEDGTLTELFSAKKYYSEEVRPPTIIGMCYFQVTDSLCLAVDKGELLSIPCSAPGEIECVGFVDAGLRLMEPSPDEDVLVLLTAQNTVITMTASFDPINEADLQQKDFGENQFITVGWGKKETQFHGSEGKAAALAKKPVQTLPLEKSDKGEPQITWRGDGALFAVNCNNLETGERFVRMFDRKGDLMYTSEPIPGLEGVVSWRPSGNLMACTQRLPNKHVVCFLEKNGLRHGDFTLPFPLDTVRVRQLIWNADSTILLAWCQVMEGVSSLAGLVPSQSTLLFWSVNNYHWYLKQRIDLDLDHSPVALRWDLDSGNCLHIICSGAKYMKYDFSWRVDHSNGMSHSDGAFVGVIDGDSLLMTSFRNSVIPPPMCGTTLKLPAPALEVVFAPQRVPALTAKEVEGRYLNTSSTEDSGFGDIVESLSSNPNNFCVMLSNGHFAAFSHVGGPRNPNPSHISVGYYQLEWGTDEQVISTRCLHHWTWISRDTMLCSATVGSISKLCVFDMDSVGSADNGRIIHRKTVELSGNVLSITQGTDANNALIQLIEGKVLCYSLESGLLSDLFTFPHPVLKMVACQVDKGNGGQQDTVLGLSSHNRLYADTDIIMSNVTSVEMHSQFLLLTNSQQQLFCCPLKKASLLSLSKTTGENESFGVVERKVERGARLVVVVPDGNRVILQMPRGNLECVEPRALSLSQMATLMNSQSYYEAFDLARKQRINLNLFVDHDASFFLTNIDTFVRRVSNPQWLCLFLAELHDDDCTKSMYKSHYSESRPISLQDKVNSVCEAVLEAVKRMPEKDAAKLTLPVLTALVLKRSSGGLEDALSLVKTLKESEEKSENAVHWTIALRHLLYLKDVNQLMDAALGMYDFNLVVLVASKSQKDPKEYLAFLNKLRQMEINYQRYNIDKHLRKWESALLHLIKCPDNHEDELLQFVMNQGLYREALAALPKNNERFRMIASAYADKLASQRLYKEAAVMYRRANDFHNALISHQKALAWINCIQDANSAGFSDEEQNVLLVELATALYDVGQFEETATIYETYLHQPLDAVKALCCGHFWSEAQRVANLHNLNTETVIRPRAVEYAETLSSQIKTLSEQFETHKARLCEVRREKQVARERQEALDGEADGYGESDLLSDTSSMTGSSLSSKASSGHSSGSNRSSKNRRKQERKVLSLKKGSPHEELALMYALHQSITSAFSQRDEVHSLNNALVEFGDDHIARDLQTSLSIILKSMETSFNNIWPTSLAPGNLQPSVQSFGPNATSNMLASSMSCAMTNQPDMNLLEPTYRFPPVIRPVKWELDLLKRVSK
ncbi:hypothetical protein ONE63_005675 [Megalurothrips usitatus]|uniref:Elongator complex protein 1 n=1 Tax=Megalurothrips usitatus TaxID=439358 RepID=A0AAV7XWB2_9NEOP|nr:hypothetical protein ONE63_005675 [Megalurothrips usitatus]